MHLSLLSLQTTIGVCRISLGVDRFSLGFDRFSFLGVDRFSLGFDRFSLGVDRCSIDFDRCAIGVDRFSIGFLYKSHKAIESAEKPLFSSHSSMCAYREPMVVQANLHNTYNCTC